MKIIIVEDERDLAELMAFNLENEGFTALFALDGKSGLDLIRREHPDLVVLDLMLPEISGTELCKILRKNEQTASLPVIMVTAKGEEIDKVVGFEVGADDYMVKPFSARELLLRIKAVLRRASPDSPSSRVTTAGPVMIDSTRHTVTVDGEEAPLTLTEFKLLQTLAERVGRTQSREQLLSTVWGYSSDADSRTVDTHITRLRGKLGSAGDMIKTVRGFGYKMEIE